MRIFLYEWITGGGLVEASGRLPESLLAEGSAMIRSLATDFARLEDLEVTVLRDVRITELPLPGCRVIDVHSAADAQSEFDRAAAAADWTLVIAPEWDGILRTTVARARGVGRVLNASDEFIALASDKHLTVERLHAAAVAAPQGRLLEADEERLPVDFEYPAVLKPLDGAGSQHTLLVHGHADEPPPYPWRRRLERYHPGRAASVAVLCGNAGFQPLPPCWQHLSTDGRFHYRGGSLILEPALRDRAVTLALDALAALPPAHGYVGVDLVLADADHQDVAIEVNPRLTTSYVGLRAVVKQNLAEAMLSAAMGRQLPLEVADCDIDFSAAGDVRIKL